MTLSLFFLPFPLARSLSHRPSQPQPNQNFQIPSSIRRRRPLGPSGGLPGCSSAGPGRPPLRLPGSRRRPVPRAAAIPTDCRRRLLRRCVAGGGLRGADAPTAVLRPAARDAATRVRAGGADVRGVSSFFRVNWERGSTRRKRRREESLTPFLHPSPDLSPPSFLLFPSKQGSAERQRLSRPVPLGPVLLLPSEPLKKKKGHRGAAALATRSSLFPGSVEHGERVGEPSQLHTCKGGEGRGMNDNENGLDEEFFLQRKNELGHFSQLFFFLLLLSLLSFFSFHRLQTLLLAALQYRSSYSRHGSAQLQSMDIALSTSLLNLLGLVNQSSSARPRA